MPTPSQWDEIWNEPPGSVLSFRRARCTIQKGPAPTARPHTEELESQDE